MRQDVLDRYPELSFRIPQALPETFSNSDEELAFINVPKGNVILTFLTVAAGETEPFELKTLHQAKNDTSWPE